MLPVQVAWLLSDAAAPPAALPAQQLLQALHTWAPLFVGLLVLKVGLDVGLRGRPLLQTLPGLRTFLAGYFLLIFAVKMVADPLLAGFDRDPQAAALVVGALLLLGGLARMAVSRQDALPLDRPWTEHRLSATPGSTQEQQVWAVRAAARVLVTAGWTTSWKRSLTLTMGGRSGVAVHLQRNPGPVTRAELEQRMLQTLAGQAAETVVFGTTLHGAAADMAAHTRLATHFFAASPDVPGLLHGAQTPEALAFNADVIRALRRAQLQVLERFFVQHRAVLDDLAHAAQQGDLDTTALQPYLDRISSPLEMAPEGGMVAGGPATAP
ncbi:hypothetical protein [Deinococcus multiflagellatus]|uniref:Uncharacterized protein n=1 Tax=Deinococcus multiflagellatus TaxID=1656887 RepID=A0ABW1ZTF1_9DEIO